MCICTLCYKGMEDMSREDRSPLIILILIQVSFIVIVAIKCFNIKYIKFDRIS